MKKEEPKLWYTRKENGDIILCPCTDSKYLPYENGAIWTALDTIKNLQKKYPLDKEIYVD